ncbi:MAG: tetratricopeptide repeat protein [Novosphingobium sp.]
MGVGFSLRAFVGLLGLSAVIPLPAWAGEPAPPPPPYEGVYQPQGVDEVGIWQKADEDERELAASPLVIKDEGLTSYLKDVLCRTVGHDRCEAVRLYVIREPTFNASMAPNGTMRVFSGLLLRVHNEAELGAVLGHEFGHFEARHTLTHFKEMRSGSDLLAWASLLASLAPSRNVYDSYQNLQISVYGQIFRHGRDQEREADRLGIGYLNRSDLPPQAAAQVWRNLMGEIDSQARTLGLKKPNFKRIAFTASHPPQAERAAYLTELADPAGTDRDNGGTRYRKMITPWLPLFLDDQIKLNDFGASDYIITQLAEFGWNAELWKARGELFRARGNQRDLVHAARFYENAIDLDPTLASAYRGLGLCLFKTGRRSEGQRALKTYLELKPEAEDAGMVRLMLPKEATQ